MPHKTTLQEIRLQPPFLKKNCQHLMTAPTSLEAKNTPTTPTDLFCYNTEGSILPARSVYGMATHKWQFTIPSSMTSIKHKKSNLLTPRSVRMYTHAADPVSPVRFYRRAGFIADWIAATYDWWHMEHTEHVHFVSMGAISPSPFKLQSIRLSV